MASLGRLLRAHSIHVNKLRLAVINISFAMFLFQKNKIAIYISVEALKSKICRHFAFIFQEVIEMYVGVFHHAE